MRIGSSHVCVAPNFYVSCVQFCFADKDSNRLNRPAGKIHEIPGLVPVVYKSL
jgi:hypothetical protein